MQLPASTQRVPLHTAPEINSRIHQSIDVNTAYYRQHPHLIPGRLAELDREWDVERLLEANAATLAFTGTAFGIVFGKKWLILPAVVTAFLLQHALQGWCPPLPLFRRMGFRTPNEIEEERQRLIAIRDSGGGHN
jgi:hypothetical protein